MDILSLCKNEGFEVTKSGKVIAYGKEYPLVHPFAIISHLYRDEENPELKYTFSKKLHDYLWPYDHITWNYWSERRFKTYVADWRIMSWAGGSNIGKSVDAAKLALIEWLSNPKENGIIVASTTLESLKGRVYGYLLSYLKGARIPLQYQISRSMPPKIMYDKDDVIHSISTIAAARGGDQAAIKNYIGRHPKRKLLLILDEGPDLDESILGAIPNLDSIPGNFKCIVIGNSASKSDLHGALSTPKGGWEVVDVNRGDHTWETNQDKGICLYFDAHESPAIFEKDPKRQAALKKFLPTKEVIDKKKLTLGEDSDAYWRFVRGFWKSTKLDDVVISKAFLDEHHVAHGTEWSGMFPIITVAGLDPSFSVGGDNCMLRFARLGTDVNGMVVLDYGGEQLLYKVPLTDLGKESIEGQIADYVLMMLRFHNCEIGNLCIDSNGAGRALGEVIRLKGGLTQSPLRLLTIGTGEVKNRNGAFDVTTKNAHELWFAFREYIQRGQIRGLDQTTQYQLFNRKVVVKDEKGNLLKKPKLENKIEFKRRMNAIMPTMGHSPDEADSASLCLQAAIINYGFSPGQKREIDSHMRGADQKFYVYRHELKKQAEVAQNVMPEPNFSGSIEDIAKFYQKGP